MNKKKLKTAVLMCGVIAFVLLAYSFVEPFLIRTRYFDGSSDLSFDQELGLRVVFVADIHCSGFFPP